MVKQAIKFIIVGFSNFFLDIAVFNALIFLTGIYGGYKIIFLNIISFAVAVSNSYFWNKRWTFKDGSSANVSEFGKFVLVTLISLAANSVVVYSLTTFVAPPFALSSSMWANVSKFLAAIVSFVINFTCYKCFIFKNR